MASGELVGENERKHSEHEINLELVRIEIRKLKDRMRIMEADQSAIKAQLDGFEDQLKASSIVDELSIRALAQKFNRKK